MVDLFKAHPQNPGFPRPARYLAKDNTDLTWSFQACHTVGAEEGGIYDHQSCCHLKLELSPGDAQHFFALRWNWTKEQIAEVAAKDPGCLWACDNCKGEYRLARFPELEWGKTPDGDQEAPEDGDFATEVGAMQTGSSAQWCPHNCVNMYWYGAGVFPKGPRREAVGIVKWPTWYQSYEIRSRMDAQERVDVLRYLRDNNSLEGYKSRFVHGTTVGDVCGFDLREPTRPPIGLNPERFAIPCTKCNAYVYRAGYSDAGSIVCATCRQ